MNANLEISGLVFEVRRGPRRKSLCLTVDRSGELVVHVPLATPEHWVTSKLLWSTKSSPRSKQWYVTSIHRSS
jgi:hypothetical protein